MRIYLDNCCFNRPYDDQKQLRIHLESLLLALLLGCEYFLTTDKRLLKYQTDKIKLLNPVDFVTVLEENND